MSKEIIHVDFIGDTIHIDDPVVFPNGNRGLMAGRIHHLTPKMVSVSYHTKKGGEIRKLLYPDEVMIIEEDAMLMFLLRKQ